MNAEKLIGQQINQYQIKRHIARGGLADVYSATDVNLEREVAIKILLPTLAHDPQFVARFDREVACLSRLNHPNIVQLYNKGDLPNGQPYIVMQYIEGGSLRDFLQFLAQRSMLLPAAQALTIVRQIADALRQVHNARIVHRNIKPSTVLLQPDGTPVLSGFGVATMQGVERITQTGTIIGTPSYMTPEQARADKLDGRSDLYSLGLVLYEMLAGKRPFEGDDPLSVLHKHIYEEPVPLEQIRPDLTLQTYHVVQSALQKDPEKRLQSASDMFEALDQAIQAEGIPSTSSLELPPAADKHDNREESQQPLNTHLPPKKDAKQPVKKLGRYLLIRELGRGGMSTIYIAHDPDLGREVAIKALPLELSHNQNFAPRFAREARVIAQLEHRAIMPIYDFGEDQGINYIVMRLLSGGNLEQRLAKEGRLSLTEMMRILRPIAEALDYAHKQGVSHRDIKPSNIGFDIDDSPVLMDFGIVHLAQQSTRLTVTGGLIGTPAYMAPEQAQGASKIGPAVDIYAIGLVAYEALAGRLPFSGDTPMQFAMAHVTENVPPITSINPSLPRAFDSIFEKVLAKDPFSRYPTASAFIDALAQVAPNKNAGALLAPLAKPSAATGSYAIPPPSVKPQPRSFPPVPRRGTGDILKEFWQRVVNDLTLFFKKEETAASPLIEVDTPVDENNEAPVELLSPSVPPSVIQSSQPSLILQPHVQNILAPIAWYTLEELMSHQEPERIVNYAVTYGSGRFILTGYGSFGGTSLAREICRLIEREIVSRKTAQNQSVLMIRLASKTVESGSSPSFTATILRKKPQDFIPLGTFAVDVKSNSEKQSLESFLDVLNNIFTEAKDSTTLRSKIDRIFKGQPPIKNLVLTIDKVIEPSILSLFLHHPLVENQPCILIVIVEREQYNRWPENVKRHLHTQSRFQVWPVPSLWESDYQIVENTVRLLFDRFQMESSEAAEKLQAFKKHIAYLGRGQIGSTFYELRQMRYWQIDKTTHQAFITFDRLDDELVNHHAWIQDLLDAHWGSILGASFPGQERTDRAKLGIYSLMDWIIDSSTFTLEEALAEAERRPVWISPYKRLRDEVVVRMLDVLVESNYLKRVENEFDVIWGRDVTDEAVSKVARTIYADQIDVLQQRLKALMDDYQSASTQLSNALNDVERQRLKRQLEKLDHEMEEIQRKLESLHGKA